MFPKTMLENLRNATSEQHKALEKDNLANKIMDHSISLEEYKRLLFQNYAAYAACEKEVKKFLPEQASNKYLKLKKDLEVLRVNVTETPLKFQCENKAEAIGAAYVLEGSAMGGMIIGKEVSFCDSLKTLPEQQFFNANRTNIKEWNNYLKFLRNREFSGKEIESAVKKAKETFDLFEKAFKLEHVNY
ncbi:biliverdin-producing heme oxygenase [Christiangramia aquimixticola]|uniref:biliverdin-producing heme oxygenase n=1 Tax=Christiangramia aquimixticola TaxID=1697558 RepID=UPI003AA809A0